MVEPFVAKIEVGPAGTNGAAACSGALVHPNWVLTARSCFASGERPVRFGAPAQAAVTTIGRADLAGDGGHVSPIVRLVPHADRDVVLVRLASPATGIPPVSVGAAAPAEGELLRLAGYGRTATEWVPNQPHAAMFRVNSVSATSVDVAAESADQADPCKGDAGGPAMRESDDRAELVAIARASWQYGCIGETTQQRGATLTRVDDLAPWIRHAIADVGVYGALADGRLTYSAIDSASGDRASMATSSTSLGFTPKTLAAVNFNTVLITDQAGVLFRVDVTSTDPLLFEPPTAIGQGFTHDLLSYDGHGSLYGLDGSDLWRYTITTAKPTRITNDTGYRGTFNMAGWTATGADWVLGTTPDGRWISYEVWQQHDDPQWTSHPLWLADDEKEIVTHVVSPGRGLYYARTSDGGLRRYLDSDPFDGSASDLRRFPDDPVDDAGWDQVVLAAVPFDPMPVSDADVSVFGVLENRRLTYSEIDSASGDRRSTVTSSTALGFEPKSLATLNHDTLLVTSTDSRLYRVDIQSTSPLTFAPPVQLATQGWSYRLLTHDGYGSVYAIDDESVLWRYNVRDPKPTSMPARERIDAGFTMSSLAGIGPDWLLGTTPDGRWITYRINLPATPRWEMHLLREGTGRVPVDHVLSPGAGVYYALTPDGVMRRYLDSDPFDGSGADLREFADDPVDTGGWTQVLLSAQPFTA